MFSFVSLLMQFWNKSESGIFIIPLDFIHYKRPETQANTLSVKNNKRHVFASSLPPSQTNLQLVTKKIGNKSKCCGKQTPSEKFLEAFPILFSGVQQV